MADIQNVKIEEQINKMMRDRAAMLQAQTREMQSQLQLSLQMKAVTDGMKAEEMLERLNEAQKAFDAIAEKAKNAGDVSSVALDAISKGADKAAQSANKVQLQAKLLQAKFPSLKTVGVAALTGLSQGFTNLLSLGKGFTGVLESAVGFIFNIGKAIISIPLNIFKNLVDMAGSFTGDTSLAQAFEALRKDFGSFKEDVSKNVITSFHEIQKGFTGTGLSAWRVLGTLADQLKYFHEIAKGAGAQMHNFGKEIATNTGIIAGMEKGLGVGAENIKAYMDKATVTGTTLTKTLKETANYSLQMGEAFGMSQKVLAKDITAMMKDVKNFGSLTQKEMSVASVYTRKLGIEVKNLLGLIDKFDTFEDAANSAAQLSQAFGGSVDAFKLMNEQDPAKRLDMLRESMKAAGKSSENMSRQELKLLEQTTGLSAETAKLAFSAKNQGLTYDQVRKASEKAEKKQISQAEAMARLADSIERVIQSGQSMKGGFLDQFFEGFERGIKWSKPFLEIMTNLRRALWDTRMAGVEVGRAFVKAFPGVEKMMSTFANMFSKDKFDKILSSVKTSFATFFKTLDTKQLIDGLQQGFFNWFDANSENGRAFITGMRSFFGALVKIAASGIKYVVEKLSKGFSDIADFLKDPKGFLNKMQSNATEEGKQWMKMFDPLFDLFKDKKLWSDLKDSAVKLLSTIWDEVVAWIKGPTFQKIAAKIMPAAIGIVLGPALTRTALSVGIETFVKGMTGQLGGAAKNIAKGAASAGSSAGLDPSKGGVFSALLGNPYVAAAAAIAAATAAGVGIRNGLDKFGSRLEKDMKKVGDKTDRAAGAATAGIVQLFSFGTIGDDAAYEIAKTVTTLSEKFWKAFDGFFGPELTKGFKDQFKMTMSVLLDLGDIFKSLMKGDVAGVSSGIGILLWDVFRAGVNQMLNLFVKLPTKIAEKLSEVFDDVSDSLDSMFKDGTGEEMMNRVIVGMEKFFTDHEFPNIGPAVLKALEVVFFKLIPALSRLGMSLSSAIGRGIWTGIKSVFGGGETSNKVFEEIENFFGKIRDIIVGKVKFVSDAMKGLRDALVPKGLNESLNKLSDGVVAKLSPKKQQAPAGAQVGAPQSDAQKSAEEEAKKQAEKTEGLDSKLYSAKMTLDTTKQLTEELKKFDIQKAVDEISMSVAKVDFSKLDTKMIDSFGKLSKSIQDFMTGLGTAVSFSEKKVADVLTVTRDIIKSVNDLNNVLNSGDASKIKLTESLKKFADNSGLGKSGNYKIENKGVTINLHLEVKMNAAEVEEAIVLRTDSLIKDAIRDSATLSSEERNKLTPFIK